MNKQEVRQLLDLTEDHRLLLCESVRSQTRHITTTTFITGEIQNSGFSKFWGDIFKNPREDGGGGTLQKDIVYLWYWYI